MADRRLQVFHAVAKHLSFTKAAEALFMTQPAVTFQIKQLEEHFNTRLFERGHGQISLTGAGKVVLDYAERILGLSNELDARLKDMTGEVGGPFHYNDPGDNVGPKACDLYLSRLLQSIKTSARTL